MRTPERLEKLEKQARFLKPVLALAAVLGVFLVFFGAVAPKGRTVEAERFIRRGAGGRERARLWQGSEKHHRVHLALRKIRVLLALRERARLLAAVSSIISPLCPEVSGVHRPGPALNNFNCFV
ncbi:hypothetical protein ACFLQ0_02640 [Nitrospinota bacterium]